MGVAHLALDLGAGHERRHRVDHDERQRARVDQHVGDLERLFAGVGLADEELVDVDAQLASVGGVEGVLGVDERGNASGALRLGDDVQAHRGLARALGPEDLDHPAAGNAADAQGDVERERPRLDGAHRDVHGVLAQPHDGAPSVLLLDLLERDVQHLVAIHASLLLITAHPGGGSSERFGLTVEHAT